MCANCATPWNGPPSSRTGNLIVPEHLPLRIRQAARAGGPRRTTNKPGASRILNARPSCQTLREHEFNRSEAARALGISRRALLYKLQRFRELGYDVGPLVVENEPGKEARAPLPAKPEGRRVS